MTEVPLWLETLQRSFLVFTGAIVAFGILTVEMDLLHQVVTALRRRLAAGEGNGSVAIPVYQQPAQGAPRGSIPRFDGHQRVQHFLMFSSFIILAITGLSMKFYRFSPAGDLIELLGGWGAVRVIHRTAAGVMLFSGFYHVVYLSRALLVGRAGRAGSWIDMIPSRKDFTDFFQQMAYYFGLRSGPPQFGRFSWAEKFDYWAVFWGIAIMGGTGLVMLFPGLVERLGGSTAVVAAVLTAHSDEAVLAVAWIGVVHLYHAHFNPRIFPFNTTIFTGRISVSRLHEEHPLEYRRLFGQMSSVAVEEPVARLQEPPRLASKAADLP